MTLEQYYSDISVRERIAEYCGAGSVNPSAFTAEYLVGLGQEMLSEGSTPQYFHSTPNANFEWLLTKNVDIFRSVWDSKNTMGVLDMEYFNLSYPAEAYFKPLEVFLKLEPAYKITCEILEEYGIPFLPLATGQGYHFAFRAPFSSAASKKLVSIGMPVPSLQEKYKNTHGRRMLQVSEETGRAYDGMGRLIEFISGKIIRRAGEKRAKGAILPVVLCDAAVGGGREAVALDLSMYGDPIYMRDIRCPFSAYQKHRIFTGKFGGRAAQEKPVFYVLPRNGLSVEELINLRTDETKTKEFAKRTTTVIPAASRGIDNLIDDYKESALYKFHKEFDSASHDDLSVWNKTYGGFDFDRLLPPCLRHCLKYPNDSLLKPTNIQTLTRVLLKLGWHSRHIGGLITSKYCGNYAWGNSWVKYDAASRSDFYVRIYAGLIMSGIDGEEDLNCLSHGEKGYCWQKFCGYNLRDYKWK